MFEITKEEIPDLERQGVVIDERFKIISAEDVNTRQRALAQREQLRDRAINLAMERAEFLIKEDVQERADVEFRRLALDYAIPYLEGVIKNKKAGDNERLKAAKMILDRALGTPKETIEVNSISLKVDI